MAEEIWIEKYRPRKLEEVVGQDEIVERLKSYVVAGKIPHLLFSGPPGSGKTACAVALAREIFGNGWHSNFLELNASDERGIDVVRGNIKNFARTASVGADFRMIFLDEADQLTPEAQSALRRTMERFSSTCRFIFSVNYSSKIIEPIQSRCAVYRFKPLSKDAIRKRISYIAKCEKLSVDEDGMNAIIEISRGDLRKAINALQSAGVMGKRIDGNLVYETVALPRPEEVMHLLQTAMKGDFLRAREILEELLSKGICGEDLLEYIHRCLFELELPDRVRVSLIDRIGETEYRIVEGANEKLQLEALMAHFALAKKSGRASYSSSLP
jgi:replication factor C small subunit